MKKQLLKLWNTKQERKQELLKRSQEVTEIQELRSINSEMETLNNDMIELRAMIDSLPGDDEGDGEPNQGEHFVPGGERRSAQPPGGFNPIATYRVGGERRSSDANVDDVFSSIEYRQAFRDYVVNGTPIPEEFRQQDFEQRADALTVVSDIGAVIPTTVLNRVIEDMTVEGKLISRINQTSYQGGVEIPISEVVPTATWLANEDSVSDEQKAKMEAKITFGYHVLEAKVAIGLLTSTVSLPIFENTVVKQLKKAMIKAIEDSIVVGTGSGQPKGFTKYDLPVEQQISMTAAEIGTVQAWAEVEGAIPEAYEDGSIYVMSKTTWEKYLNGMVDKNGQKIGLGKINEKGQKILNGREVMTLDKFKSFDAASAGDIFGAVVNINEYCLNSNLAMYYKKYFNEDKNKWIHKCLMIADGQMAIGKDSKDKLVGAGGLLYLKKADA
ncbi:phage major capsid protein [Terrisporobacter hibernicus]|uniref:Phage major capsid protein n=1 Tax=Terrisporobacter hibernicus TaxID=2813371 RepID=A0AAX2ZEV2_9FIRM|nr:phage major capsid protein [Terrisporobacter hibernicus]UEL47351.1 phage major capsid protein [Terrisporobacter hibernicus]